MLVHHLLGPFDKHSNSLPQTLRDPPPVQCLNLCKFKGTGGVVLYLRALTALVRDLGSILRTHMVAHSRSSVPLDLTPSSGLCRPCVEVVHRQNAHIK